MEGTIRHPDRKQKGISCAKGINKKETVEEIRGVMIIILTAITYKNLRWSMEARKEKRKRRGGA